MTKMIVSSTLPASEIELNPSKETKYVTPEAIEVIRENPNYWVLLAGGEHADKAYLATIEGQATAADPNIEVAFRLLKKGSRVTPTGKKSYYYKGEVWARLNCADAPAPPVASSEAAPQPEKQKKKKNKKNKTS